MRQRTSLRDITDGQKVTKSTAARLLNDYGYPCSESSVLNHARSGLLPSERTAEGVYLFTVQDLKALAARFMGEHVGAAK